MLKYRRASREVVGNERVGGILKYTKILGFFGNLVPGELKGSNKETKCQTGEGFHVIFNGSLVSSDQEGAMAKSLL